MEEIKFKLEYGVSKKGNRTINLSQIPTGKYPYERKQGFSCSQKFIDIIKAKNISDKEYFEKYLHNTVEEVFEIAFKNQDWRLVPFTPITTALNITTEIPEWVYNTNNDD